jgi:hypothetical protein
MSLSRRFHKGNRAPRVGATPYVDFHRVGPFHSGYSPAYNEGDDRNLSRWSQLLRDWAYVTLHTITQ